MFASLKTIRERRTNEIIRKVNFRVFCRQKS